MANVTFNLAVYTTTQCKISLVQKVKDSWVMKVFLVRGVFISITIYFDNNIIGTPWPEMS